MKTTGLTRDSFRLAKKQKPRGKDGKNDYQPTKNTILAFAAGYDFNSKMINPFLVKAGRAPIGIYGSKEDDVYAFMLNALGGHPRKVRNKFLKDNKVEEKDWLPLPEDEY